MSKIVVIGSMNMDLVINTPKVPAIGETILGSGFLTIPGGKGANQAVAISRLGGDVSMIGCVGNDTFGKTLIRSLCAAKVNIDGILCLDNIPTGIAMIIINDGDNFIIVDPGANYKLSPENLDSIETLIESCSLVVLQLEIPLETVERAVYIAKKHGIKLLLNPAPAVRISDKLLSNIDILTPNESECKIITGLPLDTVEDAKNAALYLKSMGVPQVIITLGGNGVVYNEDNIILHKTVPRVKVVDTTAAGDSFSGAIAFALSQGKTIGQAVDFANIVGTLTVMKNGAQSSLPTITDVYNYIKDTK